MDLIGPGDMEHHFTDAELAISNLPLKGQWVDLGSGAGFPGIALGALYPKVKVTMVESRQKRTIFLKQVVRHNKADNITILCQRTEDLEGIYDGVISRAYKPPIDYLEDAKRLTKIGSLVICMLGEHGSFEIPKEWILVDEKVYLLDDEHGLRKRWLLKRVA